MSDYTEQDRLLTEAKNAYRGKSDEQLQTDHRMLGLLGGERAKFFEWLACAELLRERGYQLNERYGLWSRGGEVG